MPTHGGSGENLMAARADAGDTGCMGAEYVSNVVVPWLFFSTYAASLAIGWATRGRVEPLYFLIIVSAQVFARYPPESARMRLAVFAGTAALFVFVLARFFRRRRALGRLEYDFGRSWSPLLTAACLAVAAGGVALIAASVYASIATTNIWRAWGTILGEILALWGWTAAKYEGDLNFYLGGVSEGLLKPRPWSSFEAFNWEQTKRGEPLLCLVKKELGGEIKIRTVQDPALEQLLLSHGLKKW
jgi:hypothetical protein